MQASPDSSRRRTFESPKDEGLAEWTSKIKAIQRQVDADEEAEQKRLEEEITASRLARQRRSRGVGYGGQTTGSLDQLRNYSTGRQEPESNTNDPTPLTDRHKRQGEALNKLSGIYTNGSSSSLTSVSLSTGKYPVAPPMQSKSTSLPMEKKTQEPMSLAAFIGGRATGPRLNKHAPQQDAHDPMQFEQRSHISAPHPVFGKGGVAMPGLASSVKTSPASTTTAVNLSDRVVQPSWSTPKRLYATEKSPTPGSSSPTKLYTEPLHPGPDENLPSERRERTMSTPSRPTMVHGLTTPRSQDDRGIRDGFRRPVSQSSLPAGAVEIRPKTPELRSKTSEGRLRQAEYRTKSPESPCKTPDSRPSVTDTQRDFTNSIGYSPPPPIVSPFSIPRTVTTYTTPPPRKSPVSSHSLARPILPDARMSPLAPSIPASHNPSPAFLRPPPPKDPTPSLSRLQGRGFVQNMVKVSSQMESMASGPAGSPTPSDRARPPSAKRSSVLDRWPAASPNQDISSPSVPPKSPSSNPNMRPVFSSLLSHTTPSPVSKPEITQPNFKASLKSTSSLPSIIQTESTASPSNHRPVIKRKSFTDQMPPEGSPGLGSSSTLLSYIKPLKTGDDPLVLPESTPSLEVDELGVRPGPSKLKPDPGPAAAVWERPTRSGKPLSHPTKDRARKPRKARDVRDNLDESKDEEVDTIVASVPDSSEIGQKQPGITSTSPLSRSAISDAPARRESPVLLGDCLVEGTHVKDRWADGTVISVKPVSRSSGFIRDTQAEHKPARNAMVGRMALPGLASERTHTQETREVDRQPLSSPQSNRLTMSDAKDLVAPLPLRSSLDVDAGSVLGDSNKEQFASVSLTLPVTSAKPSTISVPSREDRFQVITTRHARTPSSGNKTTVMDVAQALSGQASSSSPGWMEHRVDSSPRDETPSNINGSKLEEATKLTIVSRRHGISPALQAEKRKSNYEKYSAIMLPPLEEETTPTASPAGTLTRHAIPPTLEDENQNIKTEEPERKLEPSQHGPSVSPAPFQEQGDIVYFNHVDRPLPMIDIGTLVEYESDPQSNDLDETTVSVEVMLITGSTATTLKRNTAIFYDSEVLAIIHRSKSKSSGLVATTVFGWWGRRRPVNEKEQRKLQDMAKRYGTVLQTVLQSSEPLELVKILGGQLAIRQGTRNHWTSENTAMHLVRQFHCMILIDEHDLNIKNLCSGFSYCISILQTIYVWYGRGSTPQERQAALAYAHGLAANEASIIQLKEGESDNDEMFWMILGDDEYAKADYWQWRPSAIEIDPHIWRIEIANDKAVISSVLSLSREDDYQTSVYIVDCIWEFFIVVAKDARGKRPEIQLAVSIANRLATHVAASRPYRPTVHVLVLPSQFPQEFRLTFRDVDEALLNDGAVPEHMNLLSSHDALQHLQKNSWSKDALKDDTMLPLGLHL